MGLTLLVGVVGASDFLQKVVTSKAFEINSVPNPDNVRREVALEQNILALIHRVSPDIVSVATFGQLPLAVDFLWLRGLQDDRVTTRALWPKGEHPGVFYDFDLATSLDPAFFQAYHSGASFLSIVRNDYRGGLALLEKGNQWRKQNLSTMPAEIREREWLNEWTIPFALIYHYLFPLRDVVRAADAIEEAAALRNAPQFLRDMNARLKKPTGIYEIGENLLVTLIDRETNITARDELKKIGQNLRVAKFVRETNEAWRQSNFTAKKFLEEKPYDPWGGKLQINGSNQVVTTTPYEPAFGLTGLETSLN